MRGKGGGEKRWKWRKKGSKRKGETVKEGEKAENPKTSTKGSEEEAHGALRARTSY